jgi:AcrR family transcriptional regulator
MTSPSRTRRERQRAETRQAILDAARELFVELGYEATTMRAIADRVEYTPTAIYHYFRNKEELLTEICRRDFAQLAAAFLRIGRIEDPVERLDRIGEAYVEFALEFPMHYRLMFLTPRPNPEDGHDHDDPNQDAYAFLRRTCADLVATGTLRPELDDPDLLAQMAWTSLHGRMAVHVLRLNQENQPVPWRDPRETARTMRRVFMRGILADPAD